MRPFDVAQPVEGGGDRSPSAFGGHEIAGRLEGLRAAEILLPEGGDQRRIWKAETSSHCLELHPGDSLLCDLRRAPGVRSVEYLEPMGHLLAVEQLFILPHLGEVEVEASGCTPVDELDPVGPTKKVWYLGYQDVMAIGALLTTGKLDVRRVISLAGPVIGKPRLLETRIGADISQLVDGEYDAAIKVRQISGSVLCGRTAKPPHNFLGRYHTQISVIQEGDEREFLGWQKPGFDKFSTTRVFASTMLPNQKFAFTTSTGGSERAMVPLGTYEKVMPLDILPTQLLRALIVRDTDQAQQLGALELEEEDLALCTFVCPGKYEYGSLLRENLTTIEREG